MAVLRKVDPRLLQPNPDNPRRTAAAAELDEQLVASIRAIGIIQPPVVVERDGALVVKAGHRRVGAAIAAELAEIEVLVADHEEAGDLMGAVAENMVRAPMGSVDLWRAIEALEKESWSEQAIADALSLSVRAVQRLKLLARIHPPMLEVMAAGSMPGERELRTIAAASAEEQAQVWKKLRPKKKTQEVLWWDVARALAKRHIPFAVAKFGHDLARAHGVTWTEDLFAEGGKDGLYTTDVEGFFGAQEEWMRNHIAEDPKKAARNVILTVGPYGEPVLPKKSERVWGKASAKDVTGYYIDRQTGEVKTAIYRMPEPKKPAVKKDGEPDPEPETSRPDVTQKGLAMIGDFRTDALQEAIRRREVPDTTLLALLVMAFCADNVSVMTATGVPGSRVRGMWRSLIADAEVTLDPDQVRSAAREMLVTVLSCRKNGSNSGEVARVVGDLLAASDYLPNMATEEFLSALSRSKLEAIADLAGVERGARVKDTRAAVVEAYGGTRYVYPAADFPLTPEESDRARREREAQASWDRLDAEGPAADAGSDAQGVEELDELDEPDESDESELHLADAAD